MAWWEVLKVSDLDPFECRSDMDSLMESGLGVRKGSQRWLKPCGLKLKDGVAIS